jgi:Na+-translocating ferredoxin:NAD+ oxidoreductase subunit B
MNQPLIKENTMSDDVYTRLARHLDNLPSGFPATESGVELRILKRLFTAEEAEIAMGLGMMLETPDAIARRLGKDEASLAPVLYDMSKKGLIARSTKSDKSLYMAAQFVIGIWEYHVNDLDVDLIRDVNEYIPHLMKEMAKNKTQQLRVVPISRSVSAEMRVMAYEEAENIIKSQSKIRVAPCICRKEHEMVGHGCGRLLESCLVFGGAAYFYEGNDIGRDITREEALEILDKAIESGLVVQPGNSQKPSNICLCCGCCCQILKNLKRMDRPAAHVNSSYYAVVDQEACIACGVCEERCQMDAVILEDDAARIDLDRCIGCGLCVPTCDVKAVSLVQKDEAWVPPKNIVETYIHIAQERGKI